MQEVVLVATLIDVQMLVTMHVRSHVLGPVVVALAGAVVREVVRQPPELLVSLFCHLTVGLLHQVVVILRANLLHKLRHLSAVGSKDRGFVFGRSLDGQVKSAGNARLFCQRAAWNLRHAEVHPLGVLRVFLCDVQWLVCNWVSNYSTHLF